MPGLINLLLVIGATILAHRFLFKGNKREAGNSQDGRQRSTGLGVPKYVWIILLALLCINLLTGCYTRALANYEPKAVAIVVGRHANQHEFNERTYESIRLFVEDTVHGGECSIVLADGMPRHIEIVGEDGKPVPFNKEANNDSVFQRLLETRSRNVMEFLRSDATIARHPEVDLLAAIKEAERALRDSELTSKYIIIMDTGISTAGRVNLTHIDLDAINISEFISMLNEREGILPNLSGINIIFHGIGDAALPQVVPDIILPKLETFWQELLIACGAESVTFPVSATGSIANAYSEDFEGFPFVTTVNFAPHEITLRKSLLPIVVDGNSTDNKADVEPIPEEVEIGELLLPNVNFRPDAATLIDEDIAKFTLQPYADAMIAHLEANESLNLYLVGTTATTTPGGDGNIRLSQERASKLHSLLVELGVPGERVHAIGVGARDPNRVDEFVNGVFDTIIAQTNRKATVYELYNPDFQDILRYNNIDVSDLNGCEVGVQ